MKRNYWPLWLSAALCAAVYVPRLNSPFLWDDRSVVAENRVLDHPIPLKSFITRRYYDFAGEESWRPMATMSYVALVRVFGKSPTALRGFHLLLHGVNAWLLARLVIALGLSVETGAWAAALFLINAANTETLKCVAFNEEILVSLGLLAMLFFHRGRRRGLATAAFTFALLSKETGVIGIPLALFSDFLENGKPWRRWKDYALYGLPLAAYLAVHFGPMKGPTMGVAPFVLPFTTRLFFGLDSLATAARVFFLPTSLRLEYFALPPTGTADWLVWGGAGLIVLGAWMALLVRAWKRNRSVLFLLLWPLPFLALTSPFWPVTVFNTRLFAERWLYLPALGASAALAVWLARRPRLGAAVLLFWGACGWVRVADWSQETRLWSSLLDIYPWCAKAEEGMGEALFRQDDYAGALESFQRARFLRDNRQDLVLQAYAPLSQGNFVRWESPSLYRWLGHTEIKLNDVAAADDDFEQAWRLDASDSFTYKIMAYSWARIGDFTKADAWTRRGLDAHPDDPLLLRLADDVRRHRLTVHAEFP